jgi:3-deoxy-D-manno-octulosonic-acid transferase
MTLAHAAGKQVRDAAGLLAAVDAWFGDCAERLNAGAAGKRMIAANRGALTRLMALLTNLVVSGRQP